MVLRKEKRARGAVARLLGLMIVLGAATASAAPPAVSIDDVVSDPAAAWQRYLAHAELAKAYAAYDVVSDVGYKGGEVNPELCRTHADKLHSSAAAVPVSIAIEHAAMLCAEATGDDAAAERALAALTALSKHALSQSSDSLWPNPIRVLHPLDVYILLNASGLEYRYNYYGNTENRRYLPLVVATWDPEAKVERHLTFDYLDAAYSINRGDPFSGFPVQRGMLIDAFIEGQIKEGSVAGQEYQAVKAASLLKDAKSKVDALRGAAQLGGINSLKLWLYLCAANAYAGCSDGLVDALLPQAEKEHAWPMTLLAFAYAEGIGLKRDAQASDRLLDAANRRWLHDGATISYALLWMTTHQGPLPERLRSRLAQAKSRGNLDADTVLVMSKLQQDKPILDQSELNTLAQPHINGLGTGFASLASYYNKLGNKPEAEAWTRRAALAGYPAAQSAYGFKLLEDGREKNGAEARRLLADAAHGGDVSAARSMAYESTFQSHWADAEGWLLAAAGAGHIDAILDLAEIYEWERPGIHGTREQAIEAYRSLSDNNDVAEARRRLARMAIDGRGMKEDPQQARSWLLKDAERGDHASEALLGSAYLRGLLGQVDEAEGRRWIERALKANDQDAYVEYGSWLYYIKRTPETRAEAITMWQKGDALGYRLASNNLAWAWCTAPDGDVFDPKRGMEVATRMAAAADLPPSYLDTVAACHAASGDYARAIQAQLKSIENLPTGSAAGAGDGKAFRDRLALYRAGKRYVEKRSE